MERHSSGLCGEGSRYLFVRRNALKIIVFLATLILVPPALIFGGEADSIIKQQKKNKVEVENEKKRKREATEQCINEVTKIVASRMKELMDKGVEFKKNPGVAYYKNINGKKHAVIIEQGMNPFAKEATTFLVRNSMLDNKLLVLQYPPFEEGFRMRIGFQPKKGEAMYVGLWHYRDEGLEVNIYREGFKFKSLDVDEIKRKQDEIGGAVINRIYDSIDNIRKETEAKNKKERERKALEQRFNEVTKIVASEIKKLMDKGMKFKKISNPYLSPVSSIFAGRLLVEKGCCKIAFQPEGGRLIEIEIGFVLGSDYDGKKWDLRTFSLLEEWVTRTIVFDSIYDIGEVVKRRDEINENIVKMIEAAIKHGDK